MKNLDIAKKRQLGRQREAFDAGIQYLKKDAKAVINTNEFSALLIDILHEHLVKEEIEGSIRDLEQFFNVVPNDFSHTYHEQLAMVISLLLKQITLHPARTYMPWVDRLVRIITDYLKYPRPSVSHSMILYQLLSIAPYWDGILDFIMWWYVPVNFRGEDYVNGEGNGAASLAEQTFIAGTEKLMTLSDGNAENRMEQARVLYQLGEKLRHSGASTFSRYIFPYARLSRLLGYEEKGKEVLERYTRTHPNDPQGWLALSDYFDEQVDDIFYYLNFRALLTPASEIMLVPARFNILKKLTKQEYYSAAKREIILIRESGAVLQADIERQLAEWENESWYAATTPAESNKVLYYHYAPYAEDNVLEILPRIGVIKYIQYDKERIFFIVNREEYGYFYMYELPYELELIPGDHIRIRPVHQEGSHYIMASIQKTEEPNRHKVVKTVKGKIRKLVIGKFALVEDVLIPEHLLKKIHNPDRTIKLKAVANYNELKDEWGWQAVKLL